MPSSIPPILLAALQRIEPNAKFFQSQASSCQVQSSSTNKTYFAKLGSTSGSDAEQFHGEAESLRGMYTASPGICPRVFESFIDPESNRPVFISEHKNIGPFNEHSAVALASALAEMHTKGKSPTGQYGFAVPTYCGRTRMTNGWSQTWAEAFDKMIGDLLDALKHTANFNAICALGEEVRARVIPHLLGSLKIEPALLHGDLWSGNAGTDMDSGKPVIFDPSSYYGHNEAELSIARIFGGFPSAFFTAYHEHIPPAEPVAEYHQRAALYELFHYLNHTVLFGRSYESSARQKMTLLLRYVTDNKQMSTL